MWLSTKNSIYHVQRIILIYRSFKSTIRINVKWNTISIRRAIGIQTRYTTRRTPTRLIGVIKINSINFSTWDVNWKRFPIKKYSLWKITLLMKYKCLVKFVDEMWYSVWWCIIYKPLFERFIFLYITLNQYRLEYLKTIK